jgi:hypothetical protein
MRKGDAWIAWESENEVGRMDGSDIDDGQDGSGSEVTVGQQQLMMKDLKIDEGAVTGNPDFPNQIRHHRLCKAIAPVRYEE